MDDSTIEVKVTSVESAASFELETVLYDLDNQIKILSSQTDELDCLVAVASGILCSMLDILWVGDFSIKAGRSFASDKIEKLVTKAAKFRGYKGNDLKEAVKFLEKEYPIPSDGNMPDFGGSLQHHLRDFAHHPTVIGLIFSLLTQFTGMSYGTDKNGVFKVAPVSENSRAFIGKNIYNKLLNGTIVWFFHLVSDMAGSKVTVGITGGTGIPGPLLSLAKEISALPIFRNMKIGDNDLSVFLSKVFNGTLFAKRDKDGKIIKDTVVKFDLRGELGVVEQLSKQALPVVANDCIVRSFYFIRRFALALGKLNCASLGDIRLNNIDWDSVKPFGNLTITRMLTISSAVFSTIDITEAVISQKYFVTVNYVGIGRFAIAIGNEIAWHLRVRDVKRIKQMYEDIRRNTFTETDNNIYGRIEEDMDIGKFGLTLEQTEILYNLEMYKTLNDINTSGMKVDLKEGWLEEWKHYIKDGFPFFVGDENAVLHWFSIQELHNAINANRPEQPWFRLVLLEAILFEPYFPISTETNKKGEEVPSTKYSGLHMPLVGYSDAKGDKYLDGLFFAEKFYQKGYIARLRKCYDKVLLELNEVLKTAVKSISIAAVVTVATVFTAGAFAPAIAVALVGSQFTGLSGAALTSACLAYLGGGAIAAGGMGMAGGTMAIVGGGAVLGLSAGAGIGGAVGASGVCGKKDTILQSAKLIVSVREIFLNDEHDIEYSNTVYEQYVRNIADIEKELVELKLKTDTADNDEKKKLKKEIKSTEETIRAMKVAMKSMNKYNSSFALGYGADK